MIKNLLLRFVAGNLDSLIDFLTTLDTRLDSLIDAENKKADDMAVEISKMVADKNIALKRASTAANLRDGVRNITANV